MFSGAFHSALQQQGSFIDPYVLVTYTPRATYKKKKLCAFLLASSSPILAQCEIKSIEFISSSLNRRQPNQKLRIPRARGTSVPLPHHVRRHARVGVDIVQLIQPRERQVHADLGEVFADAVSRPVAERLRHRSHLRRDVGREPAFGGEGQRVRENFGVAVRGVRDGRDHDALGHKVFADLLAWGDAREADVERAPEAQGLFDAGFQVRLARQRCIRSMGPRMKVSSKEERIG